MARNSGFNGNALRSLSESNVYEGDREGQRGRGRGRGGGGGAGGLEAAVHFFPRWGFVEIIGGGGG